MMKCCSTVYVLTILFVGLASTAPTKKDFLRSLYNGKSFKAGDIWSDCTKPGDHGKVNSIDITPLPPVRGSDVTIHANLTTDEDITHATVTVDGNYNNSIPYHQTYDLCDLVKDVDKSCPIKKGVLTFKLDIDLPSEAPAGSYSGKAIAKDQHGQEILCLKVNFDLK